jgi:hypothetical protein
MTGSLLACLVAAFKKISFLDTKVYFCARNKNLLKSSTLGDIESLRVLYYPAMKGVY